ncbi:CPCC family cysteine-rich protein [Streptomyces sp. Tue6028]|uniref:CPCC family cysteine-rich protein n=1 Tax=Streptomyces sp. Tue6028 TaxID=2036037 RepID=UPI003D75BB79
MSASCPPARACGDRSVRISDPHKWTTDPNIWTTDPDSQGGQLRELRWPDWPADANRTSLIQAQHNFQDYGACDERSLEHVRPPEDDEPMDPSWRLIDPERDHFEPKPFNGPPGPPIAQS